MSTDPSACPCGSTELRPPGRWAPYWTCIVCGNGVAVLPDGEEHYWTSGVEPSPEQQAFWGERDRQWNALVGPGPGRLLDVGAGFGHFVRWAQENCWDAWGYEPDPWARARSVAAGRVVGELSEARTPLDVVTLWDVLEHSRDPVALASSLRLLLRPGGRIVVDSPNFAAMKLRWWWLRRDPQRFRRVIRPHEHATQFTETGLHRTLARAGFTEMTTLHPPLSHGESRLLDTVARLLPALRQGLFVTGIAPRDHGQRRVN